MLRRQKKTHIMRQEMPVRGPTEAFAHEVAEVPEADNQKVAEVSRKQDVVRRVLLRVAAVRRASSVLAGVAEAFVCAVPKLGVDGREDLLAVWRVAWVRQRIVELGAGVVKNRLGAARRGRAGQREGRGRVRRAPPCARARASASDTAER